MASSEALTGRRIVLTGATGGLGSMLAEALVGHGARVALVGRKQEVLDAMVERLGADTLACRADSTDEADHESVVDRVVAEWDGLDVWISNAGISPVVKKPRDLTAEEFRFIIEVNLIGSFLGARAALRVMGPGGRIIMTSSVLGQRPRRGFCAYSASKAGMEGLVRALALDVAHLGITVNAVAPGWFDSPLAEPWMRDENRAAEVMGHVPMGRWGSSDDLHGPFVFLASEASQFVTGTTIAVDGGYLLP